MLKKPQKNLRNVGTMENSIQELIRLGKQNKQFTYLVKSKLKGIQVPNIYTSVRNDEYFAVLYAGFLLGTISSNTDL